MKRREFIALLGTATLIAPSRVYAQAASKAPRRVAILAPEADEVRFARFCAELLKLGYVEGRDIEFEIRTADAKFELLPSLAAEIAIDGKADVVVAVSTPVATALQRATQTIPIVAYIAVDPVTAGLAKSLARPGGNITGVAFLAPELNAKRVELLHEIAPNARRIAAIAGKTSTPANSPGNLVALEQAGNKLGIEVGIIVVDEPAKLRDTLSPALLAGFDGIVLLPDIVFASRAAELVAVFSATGKPAIYTERHFVEAGGLISLGPNLIAGYERVAAQVDRVLEGAKPGEIPFEMPRTFELFVNLRAARGGGINLPEGIIIRADEVIE